MAAGAAVAGGAGIQPAEEEELAFGQVWKEAGNAVGGGAASGRRDVATTSSTATSTAPSTRAELPGRKSSVQFQTSDAEETIRRESVTHVHRQSQAQAHAQSSQTQSQQQAAPKRMASPPPPSSYQRGVSFDTFDTRGATTESFTLRYKHRDYVPSSRSRTFLCGTDAKDYSEYALEWLIDELVDDGDEIVCLRVIEKEVARELNLQHRDEAQKLLDSVQRKNSTEEKAISMVMELAVGKVHDIFQQMVAIYEPSALVVGTRGRNLGGMQGLLPGSVSKYCLQHSMVPVIVVRPSSKRMKKKMKRRQETGKSLYASMVEQAQQAGGSHLYDKNVDKAILSTEATKQESAAVAKAIGGSGPTRRGILKASSIGPSSRSRTGREGSVGSAGGGGGGGGGGGDGDHNDHDYADDDDDGGLAAERFALPIGYLTTEAAPRADLAMQSPSIAMLAEDWSETTEQDNHGHGHGNNVETSSNPDDDDPTLGAGKILDHRRPSTRETTPWLASILSDKPHRSAGRRAS